VPGATDKGAMKLIDVLGRLLLLALRKAGSPTRFCVAAGAVASLAGANQIGLHGAPAARGHLFTSRAATQSACSSCNKPAHV